MRILIAVCLVALAAAQHNHHPPNHHEPECHQNSDCTDPCADATEARVCINHKCECQASPVVKREHCNPHSCVCPVGQTGVCNSQGKCECGDHTGKRATCHPHQCDAGCPDGQVGVCNSQGHCECGNHVGKRASCTTATVATDCSCSKGTAVCNEHGHCHCNECMADADCSANTCHGDHVPSCDLNHNKCHCKHPHA